MDSGIGNKAYKVFSRIFPESSRAFKMPLISIITPCCRPENLEKVKASIDFSQVRKWYILYDTSKGRTYERHFEGDPKIKELDYDGTHSVAGHGQRNYALEFITEGFVYSLDDDNTIPPLFWTRLPEFDENYIYSFDQEIPQKDWHENMMNTSMVDGKRIRKGDVLKLRHIDTAQYMIPRKLFKNTRWDASKYWADGIIIEHLANVNSGFLRYVPEILCSYNSLVT